MSLLGIHWLNSFFAAVLNSKLCLLEDIYNQYHYKYVFWIDDGIVKNSDYNGVKVPDLKRIENIFSTNQKFLFTFASDR